MEDATRDGPVGNQDDLEAQVKELSDKLVAAESERTRALELLGSVEQERDQFERELNAARRRCESVEVRVGELQRQAAETERQLEAETAARIAAETDRDKFVEQVAVEEAAHARTTAAFEELQEKHEVVVEANDALTEQLNAETSAHSKTRQQRDKARKQASNRGAAAVALGVTTFGSLLSHAARKSPKGAARCTAPTT